MATQETVFASALETLSFLGREFKHHRSEDKILAIMAQTIHELTNAPKIYAIFKHRLQDSLEVAVELENGEIKASLEASNEILTEIGREPILEIIESQRPLILNRQQLIDHNLFDIPCKSWLGVPMSAVDRVLGVLVVQHPSQENAFSVEVGKVLDIITDLAANAIDYYRLHQRTRLIGELESGLTELEANDEQDLLEKIYQKI